MAPIATAGAHGTRHVVPAGWTYDPDRDATLVGGPNLTETKKFHDVERRGRAAIVIDDLASRNPWRPYWERPGREPKLWDGIRVEDRREHLRDGLEDQPAPPASADHPPRGRASPAIRIGANLGPRRDPCPHESTIATNSRLSRPVIPRHELHTVCILPSRPDMEGAIE